MICIVQAARQLPWSPQMSPQKMQFSLAARSPVCQASWPHPTGTARAIQVPRPVSLPSRLSSGVTSGTSAEGCACTSLPLLTQCPALHWAKVSKDGDPPPCPTLGSDHAPSKRLVLPSDRNFPGATNAAASRAIPGLLEKLGCSFHACLQLSWIWVPAEVLVRLDCGFPAPSLHMCLSKPACQNNLLLQWVRFRGLG